MPLGLTCIYHGGSVHHSLCLLTERTGIHLLGSICAGDAARSEQKLEDEWGILFAVIKIVRGIWKRQESWLRVLSRVALIAVPGISDHFPGDYAAALRLAITAESGSQQQH